jgi:hypothetical protein
LGRAQTHRELAQKATRNIPGGREFL